MKYYTVSVSLLVIFDDSLVIAKLEDEISLEGAENETA